MKSVPFRSAARCNGVWHTPEMIRNLVEMGNSSPGMKRTLATIMSRAKTRSDQRVMLRIKPSSWQSLNLTWNPTIAVQTNHWSTNPTSQKQRQIEMSKHTKWACFTYMSIHVTFLGPDVHLHLHPLCFFSFSFDSSKLRIVCQTSGYPWKYVYTGSTMMGI